MANQPNDVARDPVIHMDDGHTKVQVVGGEPAAIYVVGNQAVIAWSSLTTIPSPVTSSSTTTSTRTTPSSTTSSSTTLLLRLPSPSWTIATCPTPTTYPSTP
ncbi:unnamed protein product [Rotaria sordida]|uniref:Uncharacterized protein n=2 Tax=Rotaria sordida TaxID=392033 RepID=A0A814UK71_9BILA|nr:unnamed protein product [Rotaria sordida]